ncbi:MAG: lipase family protein [Rhizomicrobium sp.]
MSRFNQWDESRYVADAFAQFEATRDLALGTARGLMWASQLVYELEAIRSAKSIDKVKRIVAHWDMDYVGILSVAGFSDDILRLVPGAKLVVRDALVISGRGALIVAFCGTDPPRLQDWRVNFEAMAAAGGVSMGFGRVAANFAPQVKEHATHNPNLKLFLAGHSLGGALAVAVASLLDRQGCNVEAVYTFGMPRSGDPAFQNDYDGRLGTRTFRFVHGDDLVPTVPPARFGKIEHRHVGWFIQCDTGAKFALAQKSQNTQSNEPERDKDIVPGLLGLAGSIGRTFTALGVLLGGNGLVAASLAWLAPRVRHHLQDQYIEALTSS